MLETEVVVTGGATLSINGVKTSNLAHVAIIKQNQNAARNDMYAHRLFWVQHGELRLTWVRLMDGQVWTRSSGVLGGRRACSGGLVYIGDGSATNTMGPASLNATEGVVFENGNGAYGGGLMVYGEKSLLWTGKAVEIKSNRAYDGGGVYVSNGGKYVAVGSTITGNSVDAYGGGIYLYLKSSFRGIGSTISNNTANSNGGGAFLHYQSNFTAMGHSIISGNTAGEVSGIGFGGGIYADAPPLFQIVETTVTHNIAKKGSGGGAYVSCAIELEKDKLFDTIIQVRGSTFQANVATGFLTSQGGGMVIKNVEEGATVELMNTLFMKNTVYRGADSAQTNIRDTTDSFQASGGGLHLKSIAASNFVASGLSFESNSAEGPGGAATLHDVAPPPGSSTSALHFQDLVVQNNLARTDGGGLALLGTSSIALVDGATIQNNIALASEMNVPGWRAEWYKSATSIPGRQYRDSTKSDRDEIIEQIWFEDDSSAVAPSFKEHWGRENLFGVHFSSVLRVTANGEYKFKITSDDGSVLSINRQEICRVEGTGNDVGVVSLVRNEDYIVEVGNFDAGQNLMVPLKLKVEWQRPAGVWELLKKHDSNTLATPIYSEARGGGIYVSPLSALNMNGPCLVENNTANGGDGGGLYLDESQGSTFHHGRNGRNGGLLKVQRNTARRLSFIKDNVLLATIVGQGRGGGLYSYKSQIGSVTLPVNASFSNNVPSGIDSFSSSMFLAPPMEQYADSIVVGQNDFPYPVPTCPKGHWFPSNDNDPWTMLPKNSNGVVAGPQICYGCPTGYVTNVEGSTSCSKCQRGYFVDEMSRATCSQCPGGWLQENEGSNACTKCSSGSATNVEGSTSCSKCQRGYFVDEMGRATCSQCPGGWLQENEGGSNCTKERDGYIVLGGATSVKVPKGSRSTDCGPDNHACTSFQTCPAGWYGEDPPSVSCFECSQGRTSSRGAITCSHCAKGKYANGMGTASCIDCASGMYQPLDTQPSTQCNDCPFGWTTNNNEGESTCRDLGFTKPQDCNMEQYLNDTSMRPSEWKCVVCPNGASCLGDITWSGVKAKFGWSRCPNNRAKFEQCSFPAACLGGPNVQFQDKFKDASLDSVEQCNIAYVNGSRVCGQCDVNFSINGGFAGGKCDECLDRGSILTIAVMGVLFGIVGVVLFIHITLDQGGHLDESDGAKSIGMSFIQLIALLVSFPIAWPPIFTTIFQVGGAITVLGQNLINFKCLFPEYSESAVFYAIRVLWATAPPVLVVSCALSWVVIDRCQCSYRCHLMYYCCCRKKHSLVAFRTMHSRSETILRYRVSDLDEKIKMSCVALLYVLWPSLCTVTFSMFACRSVCDDEVDFLRADLDEPCWLGRHQMYAYGLGLPMLLLYVVGMPLAAFLRLYCLKKKFTSLKTITPKLSRIYGLLFSAFKDSTWWWEGTVAGRKIVISLIAVFGATMGAMQVHLTLLFVMAIILFTARVRPFGGSKHGLNHELEIASLMATFLTLWAGSVFNTYPKCQDPGETDGTTLPWCDALSIVAGGVDIVVVVAIVVAFLYLKREVGRDGAVETLNDEDDNGNTIGAGSDQLVIEMVRQGGDVGGGEGSTEGTKVGGERNRGDGNAPLPQLVHTLMGPGRLIERRSDGVEMIELNWEGTASKPILYRASADDDQEGVFVGSSVVSLNTSSQLGGGKVALAIAK